MYLHDKFSRKSSAASEVGEERLMFEMQALAARRIAERDRFGDSEVEKEIKSEESGKSDDGFIEGESF
jgi:hypothetical protein